MYWSKGRGNSDELVWRLRLWEGLPFHILLWYFFLFILFSPFPFILFLSFYSPTLPLELLFFSSVHTSSPPASATSTRLALSSGFAKGFEEGVDGFGMLRLLSAFTPSLSIPPFARSPKFYCYFFSYLGYLGKLLEELSTRLLMGIGGRGGNKLVLLLPFSKWIW